MEGWNWKEKIERIKKRRHNYVGLANLSQYGKLVTQTVKLGYLHKKQIEKKKRAQSLIKLILLNDGIKKENWF